MRFPDADETGRVPALLLLFAAVSLATRWLSLRVEILDVDEAAHAVGSWVLLDGGRLYRDFVDNKPPLLYAYYALVQTVLGRGLLPVHLATAALTVPLTALAASSVFRHGRRGVTAGMLHLAFGSAFLAHDVLAANAELILLLPAAWAVALVAREDGSPGVRDALLAGVLLGVATLVKQQAAFWLPALAYPLLAAGGTARGRRPLALGAGFLAPLPGVAASLDAPGGLQDLVYWTLQRNATYAANPISATEAVGRAAGTLVPWLLASAPLAWAWHRSRPRLAPAQRPTLDLLVLLGLLPALVGLRFFPHYLVPVGFALALGAAPAVEELLRAPREARCRVFLATSLLVVLGFQAVNPILYLGGRRVYRETDPVYRRTARRLARDACFPGSRLFVWGWAPAFHYYAGLE